MSRMPHYFILRLGALLISILPMFGQETIPAETTFNDDDWITSWPTELGYRYQFEMSLDGLKTWQNHSHASIGTGSVVNAYVPNEKLSDGVFLRMRRTDRTGETQSNQRPNVIMFFVDDMNDWPSAINGHALTPNMDRLADMGVTFTNAHVPTVFCAPSRNAMLTGLHPINTGLYTHNSIGAIESRDQIDIETLPAYFKRMGYNVYGSGKVQHHMPGYLDFKSWTEYFVWDPDSKRKGWPYSVWPTHNLAYPTDPETLEKGYGPIPNEVEQYMADTLSCDYAISKLQETHTQPFLITVGTFAPHTPYYVPQKYFDMYDPTDPDFYEPTVHWDDHDDLDPGLLIFNQLDLDDISSGSQTEKIHAYKAAISYADAQLGRVLDALEGSPYADNTIVMFWSDHGYHYGEKIRNHKHTLWEPTSHVPFIWAGPGITRNARHDYVVGTLSTYATLIELTGLPEVPDLDAPSLVPALQNPDTCYNHVVLQAKHTGIDLAVITDSWRYIDRSNSGLSIDELYDHRVDAPGGPDIDELNNLIFNRVGEEHEAVVAELSAYIPTQLAPFAPMRGRDFGDAILVVSGANEDYHWEYVPYPPELLYGWTDDQPLGTRLISGMQASLSLYNDAFIGTFNSNDGHYGSDDLSSRSTGANDTEAQSVTVYHDDGVEVTITNTGFMSVALMELRFDAIARYYGGPRRYEVRYVGGDLSGVANNQFIFQTGDTASFQHVGDVGDAYDVDVDLSGLNSNTLLQGESATFRIRANESGKPGPGFIDNIAIFGEVTHQ